MCIFKYNFYYIGGAISAVSMQNMQILRSSFHHNAAGPAVISDATMSLGGAIQLVDSRVILSSVGFFDNNSSDSGGGVFSSGILFFKGMWHGVDQALPSGFLSRMKRGS
jgi:hypothetical protein